MLNICQVSLKGNIPIIKENLKTFNQYYANIRLYIVCPNKDKKIFINKLKKKNIKIIGENSLISFKKFKEISNIYLQKTAYFKNIQSRLSWYYQQILKISFMIDFVEKNKQSMTIWDADTILINKLNFKNQKFSNYYGTTSYFHKAYYCTNKDILGELPNYYISSLAQFISASPLEISFLIKKLRKKKRRIVNTSEWITNIIMNSIAKSHTNYNGSLFSEYELVGQSNLIFNYKKQILVSGIRDFLSGKLTKYQIKILVILGFKYIAYEHAHLNSYSKNMLKRYQPWINFLHILLKKLSNNIYRGLKHHVSFFFNISRANIWEE